MLNKSPLLTPHFFLVLLAIFPVFSCDIAQDRDMEVDTAGVEDDRVALEAFYGATEGNTWAENEYWNTGMPLGEWTFYRFQNKKIIF